MLHIQGLTVTYGKRVALSDVNLSLTPGEILALIGPNGAGKSTLIRAVSGVVPIQSGRVTFGDRDVTSAPPVERARILGVVPQAQQLGGAFTVYQTVLLGRTAHMGWLGRPEPADAQAVAWAIQQTGLEEFVNRRNAELSGGEQQRVLLARALAAQTPVLLLDEPTNHLDLHHQINFFSLLKELTAKEKLGVLIAIHDLNQVASIADRAVLLVEGKVMADGTPHEVLTAENIRTAYQTQVRIVHLPGVGYPMVIPVYGEGEAIDGSGVKRI